MRTEDVNNKKPQENLRSRKKNLRNIFGQVMVNNQEFRIKRLRFCITENRGQKYIFIKTIITPIPKFSKFKINVALLVNRCKYCDGIK